MNEFSKYCFTIFSGGRMAVWLLKSFCRVSNLLLYADMFLNTFFIRCLSVSFFTMFVRSGGKISDNICRIYAVSIGGIFLSLKLAIVPPKYLLQSALLLVR